MCTPPPDLFPEEALGGHGRENRAQGSKGQGSQPIHLVVCSSMAGNEQKALRDNYSADTRSMSNALGYFIRTPLGHTRLREMKTRTETHIMESQKTLTMFQIHQCHQRQSGARLGDSSLTKFPTAATGIRMVQRTQTQAPNPEAREAEVSEVGEVGKAREHLPEKTATSKDPVSPGNCKMETPTQPFQ
ncbi:hypothetical protein H920_15169 [Fukomys damarensis]|uniref:Uncharacterized protein n=1 Tax=Fukomys damarensis TaxID=885580 RepID=A0A091CV00_FUKDA|nr:hypothetical protein H920_15169 [Fukomys damarensis]